MESEGDAAQRPVDEGKDLKSDELDAVLNINDGVVEGNGSNGMGNVCWDGIWIS